METKMITIPFEVEKAKKIQAGELPGKIVTHDGRNARIVCWDRKTEQKYKIVSLSDTGKFEFVSCNDETGKSDSPTENKLVLQVPEWTQYKDGDILACEVDNGGGEYYKWFSILKGEVELMFDNINFNSYVSYDHETSYNAGELTYDEHADNIDTIRLATEEEKQQLIDALKQSTDPRAKEYLKRFFGIEEEEKPECEFEPKDWVLGRMVSKTWCLCQFSHKETLFDGKVWYVAIGGIGYSQCIPYNEQTKHLLGTTEDWEEKQ